MLQSTALAHWITLAVIALAFLSTLSVLAVWRGRSARAAPRELGHSPGQQLRDALSQSGLDAAEYAALGSVVLPLAAGSYLAWWVAMGSMPERDATLLLAGAAAALQAWVLGRLWSVLRRARRLRYGYEAELVAGQELNGLGGYGYYVFHDVPLGERAAKVDHVLVGPAGVFAVQTEARARRGEAGEREVTYDGEWYDYATKYAEGQARLTVPAPVTPEQTGRFQELAVAAFRAIDCAGMARVDFFLEGDRILVNEINTIPGFTATSAYARMWEASGLAYPALVDRLLALALERHREHAR